MRAIKLLLLFCVGCVCCNNTFAQFSVSPNKRYLLKDGKPFFWLGDTAWELFHRLNKTEADTYLKKRSEQGFTVVQAVVLAEIDGLNEPNANGDKPLLNNDPAKPNEKYFEHVDYIIDKAASYNINIALLPTWGDKVFASTWGKGPEIFDEKSISVYGIWLANRYKNRKNIIWVTGGDRIPRDIKDVNTWRALGTAIMKATDNKAVISFHPQPNALGSAEWFHKDDWLSFNMFQTGHCRDEKVYDKISTVYNMQPYKPVLDGEPIYEDHPVCFNPKDLGLSSAYDVRKSAYLDLFAGAFGHTYGCHDIWQMRSDKFESVNGANITWSTAIDLPGANQMKFVRRLIESRPVLDRVPDQSVVVENNAVAAERIQATRGKDYIFVYSAAGQPFTVNAGKISGSQTKAYWYNPRNGETKAIGSFSNQQSNKFSPPRAGYGHDWVLVLDDSKSNYPQP